MVCVCACTRKLDAYRFPPCLLYKNSQTRTARQQLSKPNGKGSLLSRENRKNAPLSPRGLQPSAEAQGLKISALTQSPPPLKVLLCGHNLRSLTSVPSRRAMYRFSILTSLHYLMGTEHYLINYPTARGDVVK